MQLESARYLYFLKKKKHAKSGSLAKDLWLIYLMFSCFVNLKFAGHIAVFNEQSKLRF